MRLTFPIAAGLAAPLLYGATVAVFGTLTPGYSQFAHAISQLSLPDAPLRRWVDACFIGYNLLLVVFAMSLRHEFSRRRARVPRRIGLVLFFLGLAGIAMTTLFPMDAGGAEATFGGQMHLILAGVSSLATMLAVFLFARAMRRQPGWQRLAGYSFLTLAMIIVSGAFAAIAAWRGSPVTGLWERLTIGAFMLWLFVLALTLLFGPSDAAEEEEFGDEEEDEEE